MARPPIRQPYRPILLDLMRRRKLKAEQMVNQSLRRMVEAYSLIYKRLQPQIKNIELTIEAKPSITAQQIKQSAEYKSLISAIGGELDDFTAFARMEIKVNNPAFLELAVLGVRDMFRDYKINIVTPDAMDFLVNYLAPDGALMGRIKLWAPNCADQVTASIIEGVSLGRNPRQIARGISKSLGVGLTDAMRTTRTVQLYSYREATRMNWLANSDIVKGWIWFAELDDRTCMSCITMHGTIHPLTESLNDHYNGRCAMLPLLEGADYGLANSKEWFDGLAEAAKIKQMGAARYQAYMDGLFDFSRLSKIYNDPVYGKMRAEAPLKDLLKGFN